MYWYCGYCWYIGTLVPATLFLCTNMLLVLNWYLSLYVLVLWVLLVHWYHPLYVSVPIGYWYHTSTVLYMYWYCGYCWYADTSHFISLYQYVTGTTLVLLFICTGTVGTLGTLVPATLFFCTNMLLVLHWYYSLYVLVLWLLLEHWYQSLHFGTGHSMSMCLYVTVTTLVLLFICTGTVDTVGTLVPATLFLCPNMLLVLHWYCSLYLLVLWILLVHWYKPLYFCVPICYFYWCLYVLVLWVLVVHWYQPLYVSVPICYWHFTGIDVYMYWYCGYGWYIGNSHSMSLYQYVTGTALVLLFICTSTVDTVGTLMPANLCLCTHILLALHWY